MFFFLLLFIFTDQIFASWRQAALILVVTMDRLMDEVIETRVVNLYHSLSPAEFNR